MMQTPAHLEAMIQNIRPRPDFFAIERAEDEQGHAASERSEVHAEVDRETELKDVVWRREQHLKKLEDNRLRAIHAQLTVKKLERAHDIEQWNCYLKNPMRVHIVLQMYSDHTGFAIPALMSPRREQKLVNARFTLYWIFTTRMHRSYSHVGRIMNKDHSSVHHGVKKVNENLEMLDKAIEICDNIFSDEEIRFGPEAAE